jgi:hypothetical protein
MDEQALPCPEEQPLIGWRPFSRAPSSAGFVLSAPLIHNPDFERFPSRTIEATCYQREHPAPAPGCRCGPYAALEGNARLAASPCGLRGGRACGTRQLREDLDRFAFMQGGDDGEALFGSEVS